MVKYILFASVFCITQLYISKTKNLRSYLTLCFIEFPCMKIKKSNIIH